MPECMIYFKALEDLENFKLPSMLNTYPNLVLQKLPAILVSANGHKFNTIVFAGDDNGELQPYGTMTVSDDTLCLPEFAYAGIHLG